MKRIVFTIIMFCSLGIINAQTKSVPVSKSTVSKTTSAASATTTKAGLSKNPTAVAFKNSKDSASYALGYRIAQSLTGQGLQVLNMSMFDKGFSAGVLVKSAIPDSLLDVCIKKYQENMSLEKIKENRAVGAAFLAENAKRPGVVRLSSGLQYEVIVAGTDTAKPKLSNKVKCHYHGTLIDGTVFDSSVQRGEPISFPLNGVIKGWQDALQLMTIGSKWKLFIPSELAYGERSAGPTIGPGSTLIFEVELLGIE